MSIGGHFNLLRYRTFYGILLNKKYPLITLGNRHNECAWNFHPDGLNAQSIVYSGGVGKDISFEHALLKAYGCSVVLFDPSPTGMATMQLPENQIPQFKFMPVGLAGSCKVLHLAPPKWEEEGSWFKHDESGDTIKVPCEDLATVMKKNGHDHIDLLKIDIEGAEYELLDDLVKRRLPVKQVLVEFHHGILPGLKRSQSIRSILKMVGSGYKLLDQHGTNHVFLRPR